MKVGQYIFNLSIVFLLFSCGGDSGDDPTGPMEMMNLPAPTAATLIFPEDNTECNEGENISDTQSNVTFRWSATENTDSYQVNILNLNTNTVSTTNALTTEAPIVIQRGTPFEWSVVSLAEGTDATAVSNSARFFNQGPGIENFAPFPAEAISPVMGSTASLSANNTINLEWLTQDIDEDITSFEILFDTVNPPSNTLGETDTQNIEVDAAVDTIYFWQVISTDEQGNSSTSPVFQFRTS